MDKEDEDQLSGEGCPCVSHGHSRVGTTNRDSCGICDCCSPEMIEEINFVGLTD